MFGFLLIA